jgi:PAS domain S-box-containing protein
MTRTNRLLRVSFMLAITVLIILCILTFSRLWALMESVQLVNSTTTIKLELEKTIGSIKDAETGQRGYLLTGDTKFLEPYHSGLLDYPKHIKRIAILSKDPLQLANLVVLDSFATLRLAVFEEMLVTSIGKNVSNKKLTDGKVIMDSLRARILMMDDIEDHRLVQRQQQLARQQLLAPTYLLLLSLLAFLILCISFWQLQRALKHAQQLQGEAIENKRIQESEKEYRELADALPQLVWKTDETGRQTFASSRWKQFTGIDPKDEGSFLQIVHPDDLEGISKAWAESLADGDTYKYEVRLKSKTGAYRWFHVHGEPIKDENGRVVKWIGAFTDIDEQKISESKARESEERFRTMAEASDIMITVGDEQRHAVYFNAAWEALTGRSADELSAVGWFDLIHEADAIDYTNNYVSAFEQKIPFTGEVRIKSVTGEFKWLLAKGNPRFTSDKRFAGFISSFMDITEQKLVAQKLAAFSDELERKVVTRTEELKNSEAKFTTLFNLSPYSVSLSKVKGGQIVMANEFFFKTFGYSSNEVIGKTAAEIGLIDASSRNQFVLEIQQAGKMLNKELGYTTKTGERLTMLTSAQLVEINGEQFYLGAFIDIEERKRAEEMIALKNRDLEKMNKELESFTYISSHDLQEPLRKIQVFSSRLLEKENDNLSAFGKEQFRRMRNAAERLRILINDLLTYSRTNTAELKLEKTNLSALLATVTDDLKEEIRSKKATLEFNNMGEMNIVPFQFKQIFTNLISNSLKFSRVNVPPLLKISYEIILNDKKIAFHHIRYSDNGIGFLPEYREKIFEVFQRLHSKEEYEGTGIGLSIVKKIIENHRGYITAQSEPDEGAVFDIFIPIS